MSSIQYRVVWRREGLETRTKIVIRRPTADRFIDILVNGDPHYRCEHDERACEAVPPIVDGPHLQQRTVTDWEPAEKTVSISYEVDSETGQVTAYNDGLRIMAIGPDRRTATSRFHKALSSRKAPA